jgi:hypothetical protein
MCALALPRNLSERALTSVASSILTILNNKHPKETRIFLPFKEQVDAFVAKIKYYFLCYWT